MTLVTSNSQGGQGTPVADPWGLITQDDALVDHLMALYFCWEYPIFAPFSKQCFLADFKALRRRYCSTLLVNAILAVGHQFLDGGKDIALGEDLGKAFSTEAERLLSVEQNIPSLTTIQALGVMSIYEAREGRDKRSTFYSGQSIRMAMDMGLHLDLGTFDNRDKSEREVRVATLWGAFSLDSAWSLSTGCIPHLSPSGCLPIKPSVFDIEEDAQWIPYTNGEMASDTSLHQRSNTRSIYMALSELVEVVHDSLYLLYSPMRPLHSSDILAIYAKYLAWFSDLPVELRLGKNSTPSAFFTHMYYYFATILLFGPFVQLSFLNSTILPLEVCVQAADAIISLLGSYQQLYSLRRTPCFVPMISLAARTVHIVQASLLGQSDPADLISTLGLHEMTMSYKIATRVMEIIKVIQQLRNSGPLVVARETDLKAEIFPSRTSVCFFSSDMEVVPHTFNVLTDNSIFSPFPAQSLPSLEFSAALEELGFKLSSSLS